MKITLKILTTALILIISVSCNVNQQNNTIQDTQETDKVVSADSTATATSSITNSTKSVAQDAKLSRQQVEQLKNIKFNNNIGNPIKLEAILPTKLPPEFKVYSLEVTDLSRGSNYGASYTIIYRNDSNACFSIGASGIPLGGGPPSLANIEEVNSPALGKVNLAYTGFDKAADKPRIQAGLSGGKDFLVSYSFDSPAYLQANKLYSETLKNCNTVSQREAKQIVASLQYLNFPNYSNRIKFLNDFISEKELKIMLKKNEGRCFLGLCF